MKKALLTSIFLSILLLNENTANAAGLSDASDQYNAILELENSTLGTVDSDYELTQGSSGDFIITKYWDDNNTITPIDFSLSFKNPLGDASGQLYYYNWEIIDGQRKLVAVTNPTTSPLNYDITAKSNINIRFFLNSVNDGIDLINSYVGLTFYDSSYNVAGAAISSSANADLFQGDFIGNYIYSDRATSDNYYLTGGAIYTTNNVDDIIGSFIGNYSSSDALSGFGGAIYNSGTIGTIRSDFINNYVYAENGWAYGGAIYNTTNNINSITGDFIGNYTSSSSLSLGGAISNRKTTASISDTPTIFSITGDFIENYAYASNTGNTYGGSIYNNGTISQITGDFIGNYASSEFGTAQGGAIYNGITNEGAILTTPIIANLTGNFINNYTYSEGNTAQGGAIYNAGNVSIDADTNNVLFSGNYTQNNNTITSNAIHNASNSAILNLDAEDPYSITFNDAITGTGNSTININQNAFSTGSVIFNDIVSGNIINLYNGFLKFDEKTTDYGTNTNISSSGNLSDDVTLNLEGGTISTANGTIGTTNLGNVNLNDNVNLDIDVDLDLEIADNITLDSFTNSDPGNNWFVLGTLNIISDTTREYTTIDLFENNEIAQNIDVDLSGTLITFDTGVTGNYTGFGYNNSTGELTIIKDDFVDLKIMLGNATTLGDDRLYNLPKYNEIVTENLGALTGTSLIIEGNDLSITASPTGSISGITISSGQELTFNDVKEVSGFNGDIITATGGTVGINASENIISTFNNSISGSANIELNSDATDIGEVIFNDAISANNITISNGTVTLNDIVTTTNIINAATLNINNTLTTGVIDNTNGTFNLNSDMIMTNTFSNGTFNLNNASLTMNGVDTDFIGTTFNALNGSILTTTDDIQEYSLGNTFTLDNTNLEIDINFDFTNPIPVITNDTFTGIGSGTANLSNINIIGDIPTENISGQNGTLTIFTDASSNVEITADSSYTIFSDTYTFELLGNLNSVDYTLTSVTNTLQTAINSIATPRKYILSANEDAGTSILTGDMTIDGNGFEILTGIITIQDEADNKLTFNDTITSENLQINLSGSTDVNANELVFNSSTLDPLVTSAEIISANDDNIVTFTGNSHDVYTELINVTANIESNVTKYSQDADTIYNLNSGTLTFDKNEYLNGGNSINFAGGNLNLINSITTDIQLANLSFENSDGFISLDVDLENKEMDRLDTTLFSNPDLNSLDITKLNIFTNAVDDVTEIVFTIDDNIKDITEYTGDTTATSPIYIYDIFYNDGTFRFVKQTGEDGLNPAIKAELVSTQNIYINNIDLNKYLFSSIDSNNNLYSYKNTAGGAWIKFFASNEDFNLDNLTIDTKTQTAVVGIDSKPIKSKDGSSATYTLYFANTDSTQDYDDVNVEQKATNFGIKAVFDKGYWFTGLTGNFGVTNVEADNIYGTESFDTSTFSLSGKAGYNYKINNIFTLQPNFMVSYLNASTPDYVNSNDLTISSNDLTAINLNQELKVMANFINGWAYYGSIGYNWSVSSGGDITVENVTLPELSLDNYMEYKFGFSKSTNLGTSGYLELFTTSGDREAVGGQIGLRTSF